MNHQPQVEQKEKLRQQEQELEAYIHEPSFAKMAAIEKNEALQKLAQIKAALAKSGELDPAYRKNKNYRQGSNHNQK